MDSLTWVLDALKVHGPWGLSVMLAIILGRKHLQEDREARDRIDALEKNSVTKSDFSNLENRFENHASEMRDGQREILSLLIQRK